MKISNFKSFNESKYDENVLLFYAFDWDDNILNMPTVIHMDNLVNGEWEPTDVSTARFAEVRSDSENWRIVNNNPDQAFSEFRDFGPRGENAFMEDAKKAISNGNLGPAWDDFIECLVNGSIFAIITARGHEAPAMRLGVEWIIDNILTKDELYEMYNNLKKFVYLYKNEIEHDRLMSGKPSNNTLVSSYLDKCDYVGVSSPSRSGSAANPEKAKEDALLQFNSKINRMSNSIGMKAKVGFSDDDLKNVKHIEDLIENLHKEQFPNIIHFVVKGTKDPNAITKKIRKFESNNTPGLESSVMAFSNFNNLAIEADKQTDGLMHNGSESRQDAYGNRLKKQVKKLTQDNKINVDICKCGKNCKKRECRCKNKK